MGLMDNKVCVITGAASGIGLACTRLLLIEGARVMMVDLNKDALLKSAGELNPGKGYLDTFTADVANEEDTRNYIKRTVGKWGKIDVLFSNAGISGDIAPITDYPVEVFDQVMAVNVRASFLACKYGLANMNNGGSIVITSSVMGVTADPGVSGYAASKHALIGLARVVAKEAAERNIRVNILAPGPLENEFQVKIEERLTDIVGKDGTEMLNGLIPLSRHGKVEEIAKMFLFLASDQSGYSTGSVFMADGGMSI